MKLTNLLIFLIAGSLYSQDYKFGKVSEEELQETSNALDPEAHATILYANENVYFQYLPNKGFVVVTEVQKRIKIYDKEGVDYATEAVPFYDTGSSEGEELGSLKGYTYYLKDGKLAKDKLDKGSVFKERTNKYWNQLKFTMPNISDGCVVEYQYRKESPYISIDDVVLQYDIPVKKLDLKVNIPEYFHFNKYVNPKAIYQPVLNTSTVNRSEMVNNRSGNTIPDPNSPRTSYKVSKWDFKEIVYEANLENIPALKQEPFVDNMEVYRCKVDWEYAMYKGPDHEIKNYSTDWESVSKTIYDHENFGGQLSKTGYFEKDIDALVSGISDVNKRIDLIYNFVKSKVAWNEYLGDYAEVGVRKAYKEGSGNVGDINLMLTSMLRYAGVKANPVLISTKSNGIPLFPTREGFNYVIAAVELPNQLVLLDATDPYAMRNILPNRAMNWQGRIIREHGSSAWIDLMHPAADQKIYMAQVSFNESYGAEGRVRVLEKNVGAKNFRKNYSNMSLEERIQALEQGKGEIEISDLTVKNETELNNPNLQYTYSFKLENAIEAIGDKLYIAPMLFFATTENVFKQEERLYPLEFNHPKKHTYQISLSLPEGYKVEYLPESAQVSFNTSQGDYKYLISQDGNRIVLKADFEVSESFVMAGHYKDFKDFYGMIVDKETEKIVLVKDGPAGTE
ncbi:DUF3857 domain-containing protein [Formosa sp. S-31]|uniref:DUF3857 domain-containing protein n=1 Tax=Formosa sp. S-31 TaxID=2790949 RepID=UPI003EB7B84A